MEIEFEFHTTLNDAVDEKNVSRGSDPVSNNGEPLSEPGRESRGLTRDTTIARPTGVAGGSMPIARRFA
ncbi:MAG: hypothetical protein V5A36_04565 [Natronomonas sp.]